MIFVFFEKKHGTHTFKYVAFEYKVAFFRTARYSKWANSHSTKFMEKKGTVIMFICNHCPFVKYVFTGIDLANDYQEKGVAFVAISSNDVENYPDDAPDLMTKIAAEQNFPFSLFSMMKVKRLHEHMMLLVLLIFTSLIAASVGLSWSVG